MTSTDTTSYARFNREIGDCGKCGRLDVELIATEIPSMCADYDDGVEFQTACCKYLVEADDDYVLTEGRMVAVAQRFSAALGVPFSNGRFVGGEATVIEGAHEGSDSPFILSWEECPDLDWVMSEQLREIVDAVYGDDDVFVEPINHWSVAVYPI